MKYITIGFSTSKNKFAIGSAVIRAFEGTPYSHTYMEFWSESIFRSLIYQASHGMVNFMNVVEFQKHSKVVESYMLVVTDEQHKKILAFCVDYVGVEYGKLELIGIGLAKIKRQLGLSKTNPFKDGKKTFICSELMGYVLKILGCEFDIKELEVQGPKFIREQVRALMQEQKDRGLQ